MIVDIVYDDDLQSLLVDVDSSGEVTGRPCTRPSILSAIQEHEALIARLRALLEENNETTSNK